jgi:hypothetical protein
MNISGRDFLIGGDIITTLNGTRLTTADNVIEALKGVRVGSECDYDRIPGKADMSM